MPIEPNDLDRRIWEKELELFVPERIFDADLHCMHQDFCLSKPDDHPPEYKTTQTLGIATFDRNDIADVDANLFPGRDVHHLLFGWTCRRIDFAGHNGMKFVHG